MAKQRALFQTKAVDEAHPRWRGRALALAGLLYDLDVGFDDEVALDLHLYFLTWRDVVQWCLEQGIQTYPGGPMKYDPKLHLRFELVPRDLYVRHAWQLFGPLLRVATRFFGPVPHEPLLKKFPNYPALFGWNVLPSLCGRPTENPR